MRIPFLSGYPGQQLLILALGTVTYSAGRYMLSPLLPFIIEDLGITAGQAGISLTVMFALGSLSRYPAGKVSDEFTRKTVIVASLGTLVLGFILLAVTTTYVMLLVALVAVGLGSGMYHPTVVATLSDLFTERQGHALGINNSSIYVAGVLSAGLAAVAIDQGDWRIALFPLVTVLVLILMTVHRVNTEGYAIGRFHINIKATGKRIFTDRSVIEVLALATIMAFSWQGIIGFLPTYLSEEKGLSSVAASAAFACLFFVGIFANVTGGNVADKLKHRRIMVYGTILATMGVAIVVLTRSPVVLFGGIVVTSLGIASFWPVMQSHIMDLSPERSKAGDYGAFSTIYIAVGSLGPTYVGVVADATGYQIAFGGLVVALVVGCLVSLLYLLAD